MNVILTIAQLTIRETQRRRILWVGGLMAIIFLIFYAVGFHYVWLDLQEWPGQEAEAPSLFLILAGLYATNFLIIMTSVLIAVATVSGEIESHTMESLVTKPITRWQIIIGKWLGYAFLILLAVLLLPGGVLLVVYLRAGLVLDNVVGGLALMYLEGLVGLAVCIAGGTRLSTLANGALVFMMYGIAFVGGWVEQIGALFRNETAVDLGIVSSLIMPTEVLWKKASLFFEPRLADNLVFAGPFSVASLPSDAMIIYALLYLVGFIGLSLRSFGRRDL